MPVSSGTRPLRLRNKHNANHQHRAQSMKLKSNIPLSTPSDFTGTVMTGHPGTGKATVHEFDVRDRVPAPDSNERLLYTAVRLQPEPISK